MEEENKGTTPAPENKDGEQKVEEKPTGDQKPTEKPTNDIDYKAELEKKSKELEQAQFLLKKNNLDKKNNKSRATIEKPAGEGDGDDPTNPDIENNSVDEKLESFKLEQLQDKITDAVSALTSNEDEQKLILFHFENSIKRSGNTKEAVAADLKAARLLANAPRFEKLTGELEAKRKSDANAGGGSSGGHRIEGDEQPDLGALSDADKKFMKVYGLKPEDIKRNS